MAGQARVIDPAAQNRYIDSTARRLAALFCKNLQAALRYTKCPMCHFFYTSDRKCILLECHQMCAICFQKLNDECRICICKRPMDVKQDGFATTLPKYAVVAEQIWRLLGQAHTTCDIIDVCREELSEVKEDLSRRDGKNHTPQPQDLDADATAQAARHAFYDYFNEEKEELLKCGGCRVPFHPNPTHGAHRLSTGHIICTICCRKIFDDDLVPEGLGPIDDDEFYVIKFPAVFPQMTRLSVLFWKMHEFVDDQSKALEVVMGELDNANRALLGMKPNTLENKEEWAGGPAGGSTHSGRQMQRETTVDPMDREEEEEPAVADGRRKTVTSVKGDQEKNLRPQRKEDKGERAPSRGPTQVINVKKETKPITRPTRTPHAVVHVDEEALENDPPSPPPPRRRVAVKTAAAPEAAVSVAVVGVEMRMVDSDGTSSGRSQKPQRAAAARARVNMSSKRP